VQVRTAALRARGIEPSAQPIGPSGRIGQAFKESAEVQAGSNGENRESLTTSQIREHFKRTLTIFTRREDFHGGNYVDHVVRDAAALGGGRFRRTDIETAIYLR
jgi:hypothetical protein